jgi:hypothetical protein
MKSLFALLLSLACFAAHAQRAQQAFTSPVKGFEQNKGQFVSMDGKTLPNTLFKVSGPLCDVWVTTTGLTYVFKNKADVALAVKDTIGQSTSVHYSRTDLVLQGASIKQENIVTEGKLTHYTNYYLAHCPQGILNVNSFSKLVIKNVYPNIDWVFNVTANGIKYDFVVNVGGDYNQIQLLYKWADVALKNGNLFVSNHNGSFTENAPVVFDEDNNPIKSTFELTKRNETEWKVDFKLNRIPKGKFTIDPYQLIWGTAFTGYINACAIDKNDDFYVTGKCISSLTIPVLNPGGGYYFDGSFNGGSYDACLAKFNGTDVLLWCTYFGGSNYDAFKHISINNSFIGLIGKTTSTDLPLLNPGGGAYFDNSFTGSSSLANSFIVKFNIDGSLNWSTYFGNVDVLFLNLLDENDNLFVSGYEPYDTTVLVNAGGTAYFDTVSMMQETYIAKFNSNCQLVHSTYFGGDNDDFINDMALDKNGNLILFGFTTSDNFPTKDYFNTYLDDTLSGSDFFVSRFTNDLELHWSTLLGGSGSEINPKGCVQKNGDVFIAGTSSSINYPVTDPGNGAYFNPIALASYETVYTKLDSNLMMKWSTYFGKTSDDTGPTNVIADNNNNVYLLKEIPSVHDSIYVTDPGYSAFITKYDSSSGTLGVLEAFNELGQLYWSTYFYNSLSNNPHNRQMAINSNNDLYYVGYKGGSFTKPLHDPGSGAYYNSDVINGVSYLMRFSGCDISLSAVVNDVGTTPYSSIDLTINGGLGPYSYLWLPDSSLGASLDSLSPGLYSVIVTDVEGCQVTETFHIGTLGFSNQSNDNEFQVYPNPANDFIYVSSASNNTFNVVLSDATGRVLFQTNYAGNHLSIYTGNLSNGIYQLGIPDKNYCKKIVVSR